MSIPQNMAFSGGDGAALATEIDWPLGLDHSRNECMMLHGTSRKLADIIVQAGFEERVANAQGRFGTGIYFADRSSKAEEYSGSGKSNLVMFLTRVTLGRPCCTKKVMRGLRRPPCLSGCGQACAHRRFDSVAVAKSIRNREFIIYDRRLAYPEFMVEFSRP